MQVFTVGTNLPWAFSSANVMLGGIVKLSNGSSSAHVTNMRIRAKLTSTFSPVERIY